MSANSVHSVHHYKESRAVQPPQYQTSQKGVEIVDECAYSAVFSLQCLLGTTCPHFRPLLYARGYPTKRRYKNQFYHNNRDMTKRDSYRVFILLRVSILLVVFAAPTCSMISCFVQITGRRAQTRPRTCPCNRCRLPRRASPPYRRSRSWPGGRGGPLRTCRS